MLDSTKLFRVIAYVSFGVVCHLLQNVGDGFPGWFHSRMIWYC
ncbi:hypothetical protein SLEP1_g23241 [Rubroshorea leprosula]|uniref:Uncharacterized protein n=1 Tax=Rubroshorea leprosula TaxID=152421 RepID=A0AAV5JL95_9ROSI|nr:hypothetical protein SLEP1_g23241 [Rubroshorea leprosula]